MYRWHPRYFRIAAKTMACGLARLTDCKITKIPQFPPISREKHSLRVAVPIKGRETILTFYGECQHSSPSPPRLYPYLLSIILRLIVLKLIILKVYNNKAYDNKTYNTIEYGWIRPRFRMNHSWYHSDKRKSLADYADYADFWSLTLPDYTDLSILSRLDRRIPREKWQ